MRRFFTLFLGGAAWLASALAYPALASAQSICAPGDKAQVLWNGSWYPATVRRARGGNCFIHYDGYGNNWDEWVGPNRIRVATGNSVVVGAPPAVAIQEGAAVQVLWGHRWWPAHVLQAKGNRLFIHYDGYGNNWDEWVGPARYRLP